ncbi:hypothetical protein K466DRAFT_589067 [Polyporus arcularius HHB13444]|uniref:Uncharacterized protein n=1 Tax=Polyporus arcularius HHB13444 TaxID=1314778 RepID=A0A5C3P3N6_9APHY|nr:hypothetical protein K466DRAFT_589067 [Polyporus arcularius HHB13444]
MSDPNVYSVRTPDSRYAIRIWDGGMGGYGQSSSTSSTSSGGYPSTCPWDTPCTPRRPQYLKTPALAIPRPGIPCRLAQHPSGLGEIRSWERNQNLHSFPEGEERCNISEGAYITLQRTGHPDSLFQMPTRRTVVAAQPQMGPLC